MVLGDSEHYFGVRDLEILQNIFMIFKLISSVKFGERLQHKNKLSPFSSNLSESTERNILLRRQIFV
jgi:hypothetical protein